jgi:bacillithiol system protein YtxJ
MEWIPLTDAAQLEGIASKSHSRPQVIFKHSTRCSISSVAMQRLKRGMVPGEFDFYYLDLISYRALSNKVADQFDVSHESPQILIICNGTCVYDESHMSISANNIIENLGTTPCEV